MSDLELSLVGQFREFHGELIALFRRVDQLGPQAAGDELESLRRPLVRRLREIGADAPGGAPPSLSRSQAAYALAVYADDQALARDWPLRDAWKELTLESELHQTDVGGTEVFRRIDKLLESGDPGAIELSRLYLLMILLGFRGELAGAGRANDLERYRRRLLALAVPSSSDGSSSPRISPSAYLHTVGHQATSLLPDLRLWGFLAGGATALLLLISFLTWQDAIGPLTPMVDRILSSKPTS